MNDWLETTQGANWLADAANALCDGNELKIGGHARVSLADFDEAVQAHAVKNVPDNENWLGQLLIAVADYEHGAAHYAMKRLMGDKSVEDIATELCRPHAAMALAEIIEQNRDEAA